MKTLTILGSTGSIGRQTLEVAEHLGMKIAALTAYGNAELLKEQVRKYDVKAFALGSEQGGAAAITDIAGNSGADIVVTAIAGEAGLEPTLAALKTGKRVALANKEPLVCAGELVMQTAREYGAEIIPVDSEHSAIFQCLAERRGGGFNGDRKEVRCGDRPSSECNGDRRSSDCQIKKIILTASGGPFRGMTREELREVTPKQALRHPNWNMGQKITIDSATMMNKGLELIEAMHLFGVNPEQIEVAIHPESIIHSMVEFADGSTIAQMSHPDMRMPIQYALTYPERLSGLTKPLDLTAIGKLTFEKPSFENFPCLRLAYEAAKRGTAACAALNRANEKAVALFLRGEIGFNEISEIIERAF